MTQVNVREKTIYLCGCGTPSKYLGECCDPYDCMHHEMCGDGMLIPLAQYREETGDYSFE